MGFKECPNYIETIWQEDGNPQPKIVKDCAPRRTQLLLQDLHNRTFALQKQTSQTEAELAKLRAIFNNILNVEYERVDKPLMLTKEAT